MFIDGVGQFRVDFSIEHHRRDIEGFLIRHTLAIHELRLEAQTLHQAGDLRSAAVNHDGFDADVMQQHDIANHGFLERRINHRRPAVFHNHGASAKYPNVGHGVEEDVGH